jgi:RNA polymerase sigma-70 factor (ECF subfamily)
MSSPQQEAVTELLLNWREGERGALDQLIPIVYSELRRLARAHMRRERPGHTLQTSALINEAYMRLIGGKITWQNRAHFFGVASRLMRQILVDYARKRSATKRGGSDQLQVSLEDIAVSAESDAVELISLDNALRNLAAMDQRMSQVVELRYFGGLTIAETAEVLEVSHATVEEDWKVARAWLRKEMTR